MDRINHEMAKVVVALTTLRCDFNIHTNLVTIGGRVGLFCEAMSKNEVDKLENTWALLFY